MKLIRVSAVVCLLVAAASAQIIKPGGGGGGSAVVPANQICDFTAATSCTITHNLNTLNILTECRAGANGTGAEIAITSRSSQTVNAVTLNFSSSTGAMLRERHWRYRRDWSNGGNRCSGR